MWNPFLTFYQWARECTGLEIVPVLVTALIIIVCTIIVASLVSRGIKKLLSKSKVPLPSMSIYLNIARFFVWAIGLSILLSTCFNIDMTGIIAALGVTGIAISLGFKDTISNLISGIEITACKILEPGDHVMISNLTGIVEDTTWRHTKIKDMAGETIIVPNSVINSSSIVKLQPFKCVRVHIQLHSKSEALTDVSNKIAEEVRYAVKPYGPLAEDVSIKFSSIADGGAKGSVVVKFLNDIDAATTLNVKDIIIKVIAPYVEAAKQ